MIDQDIIEEHHESSELLSETNSSYHQCLPLLTDISLPLQRIQWRFRQRRSAINSRIRNPKSQKHHPHCSSVYNGWKRGSRSRVEEVGDVLERLPMAAFLQGPTWRIDWRHRRRGKVLLVGVMGRKVGDGHC